MNNYTELNTFIEQNLIELSAKRLIALKNLEFLKLLKQKLPS